MPFIVLRNAVIVFIFVSVRRPKCDTYYDAKEAAGSISMQDGQVETDYGYETKIIVFLARTY